MAASDFSILTIIQLFLILVILFLSLNYKYCIIGRHSFLYIFISINILVVLHLWSHFNFLLSILLLIPKRINLVTRLRTGLSHLREHKCKHSFQDSWNSVCRCGTDVKSCVHYFLHCPLFQNERLILLNIVKNIDSKLFDSDLRLTQILLFGDKSLDVNTNSSILNATIDFVLSSKRFEEPIF